MRKIIALCTALPVATAFAATPVVPAPGIYTVSNYVVSASATNGGTCNYPAKTYYSDYYTYPGPNKPGAYAQEFFVGPGLGYVDRLAFPVTPAAGATSQSGTYVSTVLPGGSPVSGTFTTHFTIIDATSWVATATYVYPLSASSVCTTEYQEVLVRSGR